MQNQFCKEVEINKVFKIVRKQQSRMQRVTLLIKILKSLIYKEMHSE